MTAPQSLPARLSAGLSRRSLLPLLLLLQLAACAGDPPPAPRGGEAAPPPAVEAVPARHGALPREEILSGVVRARDQVAIRPEIEATVTAVEVRSGAPVERGQVLVRLDDTPLRERLRQAEAAVRLAVANAAEARARVAEIQGQVERTRALTAEQLLSQQLLDTQEAQLDAARARLDQAEASVAERASSVDERRSDLAKTVIRAPFAGHVGQRHAEPGMLVDSGDTLFVLGDLRRLIVEVPLTEALLAEVEVGTPVELTGRSVKEPVKATVTRISPFLDQASFSTTAEIDLDNADGRLRPGMFVRVRLELGASEQATLVPASCLWEDPQTGGSVVFRVIDTDGLDEPDAPPGPESRMPDARRAVEMITIERMADGRQAVGVRGIEPGDWVVTVGQHLLQQELRAGAELSARVRPTTWERVLQLERLQREDLLSGFLDRQRIVAATYGSRIPQDASAVDRLLAREQTPTAADRN